MKMITMVAHAYKTSSTHQDCLRAAMIIKQVMDGQSLGNSNANKPFKQETALTKQLCYGTLRWFFQLDTIAKQLLTKPLPKKQQLIYTLILIGHYQLLFAVDPSLLPTVVKEPTIHTRFRLL